MLAMTTLGGDALATSALVIRIDRLGKNFRSQRQKSSGSTLNRKYRGENSYSKFVEKSNDCV